MNAELTVRDPVATRKQNKARTNVIAMPAPKAADNTNKKAADSRTLQMPSLIATAGFRFLQCRGDLDRFRQSGGMEITRRQAQGVLLYAICQALFGDSGRAA